MIFIFIIPLIILITSCISRAVSGPYWQYADPCYNYLFDGFQIVKGQAPTDITHPGIPLKILIAITVWLFNLGRSSVGAIDQALINPEFYLRAVYIILLAASFLTSIILGFYVYRKTNDKIAVLLSQLVGLSFLIMPSFDNGVFPVLPVVANINAEPVFIILMNLFNLLILRLYFSDKKPQELNIVLLLAFVCGLGVASKLNFLIILLAALMIVPLRKKFLFIVACIISFFIWTIPIISKYPQLFQWISDIVDHSSRYGTGDKKFIDWQQFFFFLKVMMRYDWFFILSALGLWIWSSISICSDFNNRKLRFIWALTFCCLLQIMATAKHFSFHYLLPVFALFGSIFPIFYLSQDSKNKILKMLTAAFILIFTAVCIYGTIPYYGRLSVLSQDIHQFNDKVTAKYPQCTIIPATTGDVDLFLNEQEALQRVNGSTYRLESDDLTRLYPKSYYFFSEEVTAPDTNVESYGIWNFKQRIYGDDVLNSCPCAIFTKYISDFSAYPYQVHLLEKSKYLNALALTNSSEKEANILFTQTMEFAKKGDYRQALLFGLKSRELNYEPRGQLEYILTAIYQNYVKSNPSNQKQ